jgi:hypothetical protein
LAEAKDDSGIQVCRRRPAGQTITPHEDHLQYLSPEKKKAEIAIRQGHPRGALRANANIKL